MTLSSGRKVNSASAVEAQKKIANVQELGPPKESKKSPSYGAYQNDQEKQTRLRRNTMQFPVPPLSTSPEPAVIRLKSVDRFYSGNLQASEPQVIHSSYPEERSTSLEPESIGIRRMEHIEGSNLIVLSSASSTNLLSQFDPYEQIVREGDSGMSASVSGPLDSDDLKGEQASKLSVPKVRSPDNDSPGDRRSDWSEGQNLIQKFGYLSPNEIEASVKSQNEKESVTDVETETLRSYNRYMTIKEHRLFGGGDRENAINSAASITGMSSKKGSLSQPWAFGDVDALERASVKSSKSEFSFSRASVRKYTGGSTRKTMVDSEDRKKSVEFKDTEQEELASSEAVYQYRLTMSPWIGIFLAFVFILLLIYATLVSIKAWSPSKVGREQVAQYFQTLDEQERYPEVTSIFDDFNLGKGKLSESFFFRNNNTLQNNDTQIDHSMVNSFKGISSKYKGDYEIRALMEDDRLKQSFYGLSYAPRGVIEPMCQVTERDVLLDVALLSRVTTRVRTYGTQCRQAELILKAFQELDLNMTIALGVWIGEDDHSNWKQMNEMKWLLSNFPKRYFNSIIIGNEVLFREDKTVRELISYVEEARTYTKSIGCGDIPIGTSELGSQVKREMVETCDFIGANIHPFFGGEAVQAGVQWTTDFLEQQVLPFVHNIRPEVQVVVTEVGWPSGGGQYMASVAGKKEMQQFLESWACSPMTQKFAWYYFEAFDEPWKKVWHEEGSKWETQWGFFTHDRKLKEAIKLPECVDTVNFSIGLGKNVSRVQ
ncbi:hypothetical protein KL946_003835 [Ogataea haglerorum]|uniref:glucan endo-1,3-beta-D-glucosidase n=1 Tax=Ogataea haglerorum TaxID=1937702 RepID=A0ABQ7RDJ7_9ASCO|nr:hypothetical protein KL946_003835 [Ogataea haglerorum]